MVLSSFKKIAIGLLVTFSGIHFAAIAPEEGMFPLSDLDRAGLQAAGLKISEKDIYNPGEVGLVDALVRVGGCTGSFVSPEGLIITNHHCAFSAVQLASTPAQDYLTNGFVAARKELEIEAKGLTIRITESYEDVSAQVLGAVSGLTDPAERIRRIQEMQKSLAEAAEKADPTIKAEVSEMFIGKSYVLFRYKTIEDVRLVYIPRQNIGEFGGETDNWIWPRHTGDYAFLRAYVAKDGSSAPYSADNVPYEPRKFLKINPAGVDEEDFVFILGYPGRTFRHRPAAYIEYQERYLLPYISELNDFMNQRMREAGAGDKGVELQLASRIKRNANVMKNYRGKMKGLRNIGLVETKKQEDAALADFIRKNTSLQTQYGGLMEDIEDIYRVIFEDAQKELWLGQIYSSTVLLQVARLVNDLKARLGNIERPEDKSAFLRQNAGRISEGLARAYSVYNAYVDEHIFAKMLEDARVLGGSNTIESVRALELSSTDEARAFASKVLSETRLGDENWVKESLVSSVSQLENYEDGLLTFQRGLQIEVEAFGKEQERREGIINELMGDYVAVKERFQQRAFVPDANATLRLTYGYIRGYSPADATYMRPFTTIRGLIEKGMSGDPEFEYPHDIRERWEARDFGPYVKQDLGDVPVNILYDMDTSGGNSGSPIMNAYGELIGVNFDRAYDATINDFAWNHSYSRSIGADIRFVLWVADKIDGAHFVLEELGIR